MVRGSQAQTHRVLARGANGSELIGKLKTLLVQEVFFPMGRMSVAWSAHIGTAVWLVRKVP